MRNASRAVLAALAGIGIVLSPISAVGAAVPTTAQGVLASLTVAAENGTGYNRSLFKHWNDADGDGCNTRSEVLQSQSEVPVTYGNGCTVATGQWYSWFDGETWTAASDVDIDHMVPLAEAWASGASAWTPTQRELFANDLDVSYALYAITDNVNQSKSDRDPAEWMPTAADTGCRYATEWVLVKYRWSLTIDPTERTALSTVLSGPCGAAPVAVPTVAIASTTAPSITVPPITVPPITVPPTTVPPTTVPPTKPPVATAPAAPAGSPVYRFWSPVFNGHFFTISRAERDTVIAKYPGIWEYEGARFNAYTSKMPGTVPLYRFWSDRYSGHFYTTSESEKNQVIAQYDDFTWKYEQVALYVYPATATYTDTLPVARFWSDTFGHHFYTASAGEAATTRKSPPHIWMYEGNRFRVPSKGSAAAPVVPVKPAPVAPPVTVPAKPANPGDTKNCGDFTTYAQAKAWFDTYYPHYGDVARLDHDNDLIPCESLPGAPR